MFIVTLLRRERNRNNQLFINKKMFIFYIYRHFLYSGYYSTKNEVQSHAISWINPGNNILSKRSKTRRSHYMIDSIHRQIQRQKMHKVVVRSCRRESRKFL